MMTDSDKRLYKGVFWITDLENMGENDLFFKIPVDSQGVIDPSVDRMSLNSKNNDNYNHKRLWERLGSKVTHGKEFDHFPRGRVEIANEKAIIYASPYICTEDIIDWIIDKFNLTEQNGIKSIRVVPDNSSHYKCHLD